MKHGYEKRNDNEVISKYTNTHDSKIIIKYIDGSTEERTFNDPIEEKRLLSELQNIMLEQASERDKELYNSKIMNHDKEKSLNNTMLSAIFTFLLLGLYTSQIRKDLPSNMILLGITAAVGITIIVNGREYVILDKTDKEVQKYHLYLENLQYLDKLSVEDLTIKGTVLNINTLDDVSIGDLIKLIKKAKSTSSNTFTKAGI